MRRKCRTCGKRRNLENFPLSNKRGPDFSCTSCINNTPKPGYRKKLMHEHIARWVEAWKCIGQRYAADHIVKSRKMVYY